VFWVITPSQLIHSYQRCCCWWWWSDTVAIRLIVHPVFQKFPLSPPDVSTSYATREIRAARGGTYWARKSSREFCLNADFHVTFRDLLHAAGFTSPPKEGVLGIFSPWKIRRLRPGLNPRTWVLGASTHPLDHRSSFTYQRFDGLYCFHLQGLTIQDE
jgi:hypothetical protein